MTEPSTGADVFRQRSEEHVHLPLQAGGGLDGKATLLRPGCRILDILTRTHHTNRLPVAILDWHDNCPCVFFSATKTTELRHIGMEAGSVNDIQGCNLRSRRTSGAGGYSSTSQRPGQSASGHSHQAAGRVYSAKEADGLPCGCNRRASRPGWTVSAACNAT